MEIDELTALARLHGIQFVLYNSTVQYLRLGNYVWSLGTWVPLPAADLISSEDYVADPDKRHALHLQEWKVLGYPIASRRLAAQNPLVGS